MNRTRIIGFRLLKEDFNRALTAAGGQDRLSEWAKGVVLERIRPLAPREGRPIPALSKLDKPDPTPPGGSFACPGEEINDPPEYIPLKIRPSWADLTEPARVDMARVWLVKVPLPAGFKSWDADTKIAWLDSHWPLEPKGEEW